MESKDHLPYPLIQLFAEEKNVGIQIRYQATNNLYILLATHTFIANKNSLKTSEAPFSIVKSMKSTIDW